MTNGKESTIVENARATYESYNIPGLEARGLKRLREPFDSGAHTVVTYPPLGTLRKVTGRKFSSALQDSGGDVNLYIHIPYCLSKCGYCGYVSEPNPTEEEVRAYLVALQREVEMFKPVLKSRFVSSLYVGGGTPTILPIEELLRLAELGGANKCFEANPATLKGTPGAEKLKALVEKGVGRLSIGVQSFQDVLLRAIGRGIYTGAEAEESVRKAREAEFRTINVDMMSDLPGQTLASAEADLETIIRLKPDSVTWYTMRTPANCKLHRQAGEIPMRDSLIARIMIAEGLKQAGYRQTSGDRFCLSEESKDSFKSARSSVDLQMLGLGVSAYSHLGGGVFRNEINTQKYIARINDGDFAVATGRFYDMHEKIAAEFVLGLREGLELSAIGINAIFGDQKLFAGMESPSKLMHFLGYRRLVPRLIENGLLELQENCLQFTDKGRLFESEVLRMFYSPSVDAESRGKRVLGALKKFWLDFLMQPTIARA